MYSTGGDTYAVDAARKPAGDKIRDGEIEREREEARSFFG